MKNGLREINELAGIWGSLVCDNQGNLILAETPPGLNKASQENINRHILDLFNTTGQSVDEISEVVLHFSERKVFAQDLEKGLILTA